MFSKLKTYIQNLRLKKSPTSNVAISEDSPEALLIKKIFLLKEQLTLLTELQTKLTLNYNTISSKMPVHHKWTHHVTTTIPTVALLKELSDDLISINQKITFINSLLQENISTYYKSLALKTKI